MNHQDSEVYQRCGCQGEYGKFIFTRSVSAILECIAEFAANTILAGKRCRMSPLAKLFKSDSMRESPIAITSMLKEIADANRSHHRVSSAIRLPQILSDSSGVSIIPFQVSHPNFITSQKISAGSFYLGPHNVSKELKGKIVLIENADPGYDWIFAQNIKGLVTKYGGANSHMATLCRI